MTDLPDSPVPTPDQIIGPGIDAVVALRPNALPHINHGYPGAYGHVFVGLRAQAALVLRRYADLVKNAGISTAEGAPLRTLIASEFSELTDAISFDPTPAIGTLTLTRSTGVYPRGIVRQGHRFARAGNPSAIPIAIAAAEYEADETVVVEDGATTASIPIRAVRAGTHANLVRDVADVISPPVDTSIRSIDTLFDTAWSVSNADVAGGSDGPSDATLKRIALALSLGEHGPTLDGIVGGAYTFPGVAHAYAADGLVNYSTTGLAVADASWAWSDRWSKAVHQHLIDEDYVGFGCGLDWLLPVYNRFVTIDATIVLREPRYLKNTDTISAAVRAAVRSYFDDRTDFFLWKANALRGVIAHADTRILTCTSVTVKALDGTVQSEPEFEFSLTGQFAMRHWAFNDEGLRPTYSAVA